MRALALTLLAGFASANENEIVVFEDLPVSVGPNALGKISMTTSLIPSSGGIDSSLELAYWLTSKQDSGLNTNYFNDDDTVWHMAFA